MFERPHHQRIAHVLNSLNAEGLRAHGCLFGGGTCIALRHGEYRESVDIGLLISNLAGFRALREQLTGVQGIAAITRAGAPALQTAREVRADQYGIRTWVSMDASLIKFEIVLEGRITLDAPGENDRVCGVSTLTRRDLATTKLLANADRWADDGVFSRDLIDLSMLELPLPELRAALDKARQAYGGAVTRDLGRALERLQARTGWLDRCMLAMGMAMPKAVLWQKLRKLRRVLRAPDAQP